MMTQPPAQKSRKPMVEAVALRPLANVAAGILPASEGRLPAARNRLEPKKRSEKINAAFPAQPDPAGLEAPAHRQPGWLTPPEQFTRRDFLTLTSLAAASALCGCATRDAVDDAPGDYATEPVIDIHQHTNYTGRTDEQLIAHQRTLGVTHTILLPAGRYFGLEAGCGGNETVEPLAKKFPRQFSFFANEVPFIAGADVEIKKYLRRGAIGIGEQKFQIDCDSPAFQRIAAVAAEFNVPVLIHFQHDRYNTEFARFHKVLEKYPRVNFIGHAQTWWANIDREHRQPELYPKTPVTPGGLTDKYLRDYPNIYGDTSAGSGLNAFTRDEAPMRDFLARHQDKLLFGSDCNDTVGAGTKCQGAQILAAIRRLAPTKEIERKILHGNAKRLLRLPSLV